MRVRMRTEVTVAEMTYYHNGEWVPEDQVMIHPKG